MIAAVFDCMVFLQAAISDRGPSFACLALVEANQVRLYLSPAILSEVRDVLSRSEIQTKFPHLTQERVDTFVQKIATLAVLVRGVREAGFSIRDPDDLPYLSLAIAANARYLVSWDAHLRDLMRNPEFMRKYRRLLIINPVAFLEAARSEAA